MKSNQKQEQGRTAFPGSYKKRFLEIVSWHNQYIKLNKNLTSESKFPLLIN